jgi:hypothetical protein
MFAKSVKGICAAAAIAAAISSVSPMAQAAGYAHDYTTAGRGHSPGHPPQVGTDWRGGPGYGHGYPDRYYGRGVCQPQEAVHKALRFGMHRPGVERISARAIVVVGWNRGHRAKITFERYTPYCRVLETRGI